MIWTKVAPALEGLIIIHCNTDTSVFLLSVFIRSRFALSSYLSNFSMFSKYWSANSIYVKLLSWLGVGLVIRGPLVRFPAGALWSVLGQDNLFHTASVYPAAKWVPSINKAVLKTCALYAANCSGISLGELKWFPCVQDCYGRKVV